MLDQFLIALVGFSVLASLCLIAAYGPVYYRIGKSWQSIFAAVTLLLLFIAIQWWHLCYLTLGTALVSSSLYSTCVLLTPPLFLLFSMEYLGVRINRWFVLLPCILPIALNLLLDNTIGLTVGFTLGATYALYCVYRVAALKNERYRFNFEILSLTGLGLFAVVLAVLAALVPMVGEGLLVVSYGVAIALTFVGLLVTLLVYPDIALNLNETLQVKYSKTTLAHVDEQSELEKLESLLTEDKLSRNEGLNLSILAQQSGLTNHQISELINSHYGYGVSQFIRRHRVEDAKAMLLTEPAASVLSIGLQAGFTSQSSFYAAFKQEHGGSPGAFRKAATSPKPPE